MARPRIISPELLFADWQYEIRPALWPALGVVLRELIDPQKTKAARAQHIARGGDPSRRTDVKITRLAHTIATPPAYDFHEGDLFHPRPIANRCALQVIRINPHLHVLDYADHTQYSITPPLFAEWLRTGLPPHLIRT